MRYLVMPAGMWVLFRRSFTARLTDTFGYDGHEATSIARDAKARYKDIIAGLPTFERRDRFKMNIVSCAMLSAFVLSMPERPSTEMLATYYREAMMTSVMRLFCRASGRSKFSERDLRSMRKTAALRAADRNPYSWNMDFIPYADGSGYEARFTSCGICHLMAELGLFEMVPAMCALDYAMAEAGGTCDFVREHTLAASGPYCDCGYRRRVPAGVATRHV